MRYCVNGNWWVLMSNEFEGRIKHFGLKEETTQKVIQLIIEAGNEFPCLKCPSKDECDNFKWFLKWFGKQK